MLTPTNITNLVAEAFLYGLPIVMNYGIMYQFAVDTNSAQYKAPFNHMARSNATLTYRDTAVVTPNADTPYSVLWMDLRAEPLVLSVPDIDHSRYYAVQLVDLNTYNYGYIGSRTTGNGAGKYLVAGPRWRDVVPPGINGSFYSATFFSLALYRTQLFNSSDIDNVIAVENGYTFQTLSAYLGQPPENTHPLPPFMPFSGSFNVSYFFDLLDFALKYMPRPEWQRYELDMRARLVDIGARPGKLFFWTGCAANFWTYVLHGYTLGAMTLGHFLSSSGASVNGWKSGIAGGDAEHYSGNWLQRAGLAQAGIYGNDAVEAIYLSTREENETGNSINCAAHNYTLTFTDVGLPPVKAFWSLTIYDGVTQLLIQNPIDRYLINSPMLPSLQRNGDMSVTIYIQHPSPIAGLVSNWLPAPDGTVYMVLRLYWPSPNATTWKPPPVLKTA